MAEAQDGRGTEHRVETGFVLGEGAGWVSKWNFTSPLPLKDECFTPSHDNLQLCLSLSLSFSLCLSLLSLLFCSN